jgi:hypothetical protein
MYSDKIIKDLDEIVNKGLEDVAIPYAKGNSIRIKHIVIRKSRNGYLIYNAKDNVQVTRTVFKSTAIAIAKNLASDKDVLDKVIKIDNDMAKHYNDELFFKHIIKTSKDQSKIQIRENRLDIALEESSKLRNSLDRFIFGQ